MQRTNLMTVADLRTAIADLPDWALVDVAVCDETGCVTDPEDVAVTYSRGVLYIEAG